MPEEPFGDVFPLSSGRACDRCRTRKIRCDRSSPCSNCRSAGAVCKASNRPARPKRSRILLSSQFEEKIDLIDKRLGRLNHLVESLIAANSATLTGIVPSCLSHPNSSTTPPFSRNKPPQSTLVGTSTAKGPDQNFQSSNKRVTAPLTEITNSVVPAEGQSSLTAHTTFAIDFAHNIVGSDQRRGRHSREIGTLLDTLRHIGNAFNDQRLHSKPLFPLVESTASLNHDEYDMPPLRAAVHVLRQAQDKRNLLLLALCHLLSLQNLSDLCLKVYFSSDYSEAEFIIVNAALSCLSSDTDIGENDIEAQDEHNRLIFLCRRNLEIVLSRLTLYIDPSYEMTLALALGVFYAIDVSNPSLAWILVGAAYRCSHSLGYNTSPNSSDEITNQPDQKQLLFWAIFVLEKSLSIRLGRSSSIPDYNSTALSSESLQASSCHAIIYVDQSAKLASLTSRIYEQLYSGDALLLPEAGRTHRALELSQELHGYCAEARATNQAWIESTKNKDEQQQIHFISACDEVSRLSMLTLIYRAMPPEPNSGTTFSIGCVTSARCALESHQLFIRNFRIEDSPLLLSAYVKWTILLTPFIPFIVLFCHAIEARDKEDLNRMHNFIKSIERACQHSNAIAKHHRLFELFYSVALRYSELGLPSSPMEEEQVKLRSEVEEHLNLLGIQSHTGYVNVHHTQENDDLTSSNPSSVGAIEHNRAAEGNNLEQNPPLGRWFHFNQQMLDLLDYDCLPF